MDSKEVAKKFQTPGRIKIVEQSILAPQNGGLRLVLNVANMAGKADNRLYSIFDKKWAKVKQDTKGWYNTRTGAYKLGALFTTACQSDTWTITMLCQDEHGQMDMAGLTACLKNLCKMAKDEKASIHVSSVLVDDMPEIQEMLNDLLVKEGVSVVYYTGDTV